MTSRFKSLEHPLALGALGLLVFNDHWLKQHHPGWLSGKLSDVAGLILLPLWVEIVLRSAQRRMGKVVDISPRGLRATALWVSFAFFCAIQLSQTANNAVGFALGVAQWPFWALGALLDGKSLPSLRTTLGVADLGDLLTLPVLWLTRFVPYPSEPAPSADVPDAPAGELRLAPRASRRVTLPALKHLVPLLLFATLSALSPGLSAKPSMGEDATPRPANLEGCPLGKERDKSTRFCHDGFHLAFELGGGFTSAWSDQSISNGFQQDIPSRVNGFSAPDFALHIGGTLAPGWVLGWHAGATYLHGAYLETLGQDVYIEDLQLTFIEFGAFLTYYPDPGGGRFLRTSLSLASIEAADQATEGFDKGTSFGDDPRGAAMTFAAGQEFWFAGQWAFVFSGSLRLFQALERTQTFAIGPSLAAGVVFQ